MKPTYTSPSQIALFLECPRHWWSERVAKLPVPQRSVQTFGTVAHACIMLSLEGKDPYPTGWEVARNPYTGEEIGCLTEKEQAELRGLMDKEWAAFLHRPGEVGNLEEEFKISAPNAVIMGRMDQRIENLVIDHKVNKTAAYVPSPEQLRDDVKMRCYAVVAFQRTAAPDVTMRLQHFIRVPGSQPVVVSATIGRDELREWWKTKVLPAIEDMVRMKEENVSADRWMTIPGPNNPKACDAYGGCPFKSRCFPPDEAPF